MDAIDTLFGALSDPTRRAILVRLAQGEATVGTLSRPFAISAPAISRHLRVLEDAELITNERRGKERLCRLRPETLTKAQEWLDFTRQTEPGGIEKSQLPNKSLRIRR